MDWVYYESKYWELREDAERKWDAWVGNPKQTELYDEYMTANRKFMCFCTDVLNELMDKNTDVLARLKG